MKAIILMACMLATSISVEAYQRTTITPTYGNSNSNTYNYRTSGSNGYSRGKVTIQPSYGNSFRVKDRNRTTGTTTRSRCRTYGNRTTCTSY